MTTILRIGTAAIVAGMIMLTLLFATGNDFFARIMLAAAFIALWCIVIFLIVLAFKKP